jgi:hypothetical protein
MTEAEWLANTSSKRMLHFLGWPPGQRKMLLFAAACCSRLADLDQPWLPLSCVRIVERFADGLASEAERRAAFEEAVACHDALYLPNARLGPRYFFEHEGLLRLTHAADAIAHAVKLCGHEGAASTSLHETWVVASRCQNALFDCVPGADPNTDEDEFGVDIRRQFESRWQARALRDIVGNPFHPVALDPRWRTASVRDLASAVYEDALTDRMPILADALEDAGCGDERIIRHCRDGGIHVRGCWVIDLLLHKK